MRNTLLKINQVLSYTYWKSFRKHFSKVTDQLSDTNFPQKPGYPLRIRM